ncbi:MAG: hemerythrin domain-containing protein [Betaproteobacteria bacterium]
MKSLSIIRDEHRALAAVLQGLGYLVEQIRERGAAPDFAVLSAMIYYIDAFPERFHHPKEDRYLFALLRSRCPAAGGLIDHLQADHVEGAQKIRALEQWLTRYREGGATEFPAFAAALDGYVGFELEHIRREERELLPLAREHLTADDWSRVDSAFSGTTDPLLGVAPGEHWERLFRRIATIAPAPIGVGPPSRPR